MDHESVEDLRAVLAKIEQAIGGAASKAPRAQFLKAIAFLDGHVGKSISELVGELDAAKPQPKPKVAKTPTTKPRVTKPKVPVQTDVVERYVANLRAAENTLEAFNALIIEMKGDKAVRLDELKLIVPQYSGDTTAVKTKPTAIGVIQRTFDARWNLRQHTAGAPH